MTETYAFLTIEELSDLIKTGQVSPVDVVKECLGRINNLQLELNAFITILGEQALADAEKAEKEINAGNWRGPLHGVPVALKDMYDTAGIRTTAAFEHFTDRVPEKDAAIVTKLKDAGAIIIGKTNMHKLAMGTTSLDSPFGPVKNPWNVDYIAGGSSGGSAAAVATGLCFATIDTDAVGSCRLPAACCGVVGYKCTWGLIDNTGILADQPADPIILNLATAAITTRSASDTEIILDIVTKQGDAKSAHLKRLGIVSNFGAEQTVHDNFLTATQIFKELGYELVDVTVPFTDNPDMQHIDEKRKSANDILDGVEAMLLPTLASTVPKIENTSTDPQALSPQNTFFVNYYGLPAVSVPSGFDVNGLPLGLQIVGRLNEDSTVLRLAEIYQQATKSEIRHPQVKRAS